MAPETSHPRSTFFSGIRWCGEVIRTPDLDGDTWSPAWMPDGSLIASADDTLGLHQSTNSNLAIYRIEGEPGGHSVELVNPMSAYGTRGQHEGWASWKANGMTCVDGSLYLSVSQHRYWRADLIQRAYDASIIRSDDGGRSWSPKPHLGKAMFPDTFFATPWFVDHGRDHRDCPDDKLYAVSNDGTWNNGTFMMLGRVRRDRLPRLDPADWQFFAGLDDVGRPRWNDHLVRLGRKAQPSDDIGDFPDLLSTPAPLFVDRLRVGMCGMSYLPALERYIMGQWWFPALDSEGFGRTSLLLLEAPQPWGPWAWFHYEPCWQNVYYCPSFPSIWFSVDNRRIWMTASGAFFGNPRPDYTLAMQELELVLA